MGLGFTVRRTHQFLGGVLGPDSQEQIRHIEATNCAARAVGSSATARPHTHTHIQVLSLSLSPSLSLPLTLSLSLSHSLTQ
jgi:hypothetical protein